MTKTAAVITGMITFMVLMTCLTIQEAVHLTHDRTVQAVAPVAAQQATPIVVYVTQQPTAPAASTPRTERVAEAKATKKAEKPATKATKAPAPTKATKAPSNEELAYRIDQLAEDTCEHGRGGRVAEDYTCVDYHGKVADKATAKASKAPAANAGTVPLGEGKQRCPNGYQRDKADRTLCVAKS